MRLIPLLCAMSLLAACHPADRPGPAHLAKARQLFAAGRLASAGVEITAALAADPRSRDARFLAGRIAAASGDDRTAYVEYARADMLDPGDHRARSAVIELLLDAGGTDAALARINTSLGDDPRNVDALAFRALVAQQRGDPAKARRDAQAVLVIAAGHPLAHAVLAALALGEGATDDARAELGRGLATDPTNRWLLQLAAGLALRDKATGDALALDRRLVEAHPEFPRLNVTLAGLEAAGGDGAAAEATLRQAVDTAPRSLPLRFALADFLRHGRQDDAADAVLRQAMAAFPGESAPDVALAADLARRGQPQAAQQVLQAAIARLADGPARGGARRAEARLMIAEGSLRAARTALDAMIRADPTDDAALLLRAEIARPDEDGQAIADLLAVSGRRPADPHVYELLVKAELRGGRIDEAAAAARRVADLRPDDPADAARFADLAVAAGRPGEGRSVLEDLAARDPASPRARAALVRFLIAQKDWGAAEAALDGLRGMPEGDAPALDLAAALRGAQGRPGEAADLYAGRLAGAADPGLKLVWAVAYGRAALAAGRGPEATSRLQALTLELPPPQAAALHLAVASLQGALHQGDAAVASDDAAIRATPQAAEGYLRKSADLATLGRTVEAVAALDAGLAADAPPVPLLQAKAALQLTARATDQAIATYRLALAKAPRDGVAANNLASLLADRKPIDAGALAAARDALRPFAASAEPHLLDTLAWADYRLGDLDDARDLLGRAGAATSASPELRFHYGAVLMATGDKARGQALIRGVIDKAFTGQNEARALLTD